MANFYAFEFENDNFKGGYIMTEKNIKSRIIHKHDTSAHWDLATNFIPMKGEIIIYDDLKKIKIGDGETTVVNLDFMDGGVEIDTSDFVSKSETDSQYLSGALEVLDYLGVTNSSNGDYYLTLGADELAVGDGNGGEYIYTFDNQGGVIATQDWVQANVPSIDTDNFVVKNTDEDEQTINCSLNVTRSMTVLPDDGENYVAVTPTGFEYFLGSAENVLNLPEGVNEETIATQEWILNQNYLISEDLSLYAKLTDIPNTSNFATLSGTNEFSNSLAAPEFTTTMNDEYKYATYYPNHIYYVDDSEGMAYSSELIFPTSEVGTIATREWVQANAPSVDTSNLVDKSSNQTITGVKTFTQTITAPSYKTDNVGVTHMDYQYAEFLPTAIKIVATDYYNGGTYEAATTEYTLTLPNENGTLATQEWIQANAGGSSGNYVELGTRPTTSPLANPSQTIYTDINIGDSEASGYASYNLTTWGWYGGYIKLNPGSPAIEVQTPMASTSRSFQFPEAGGILATQNWVAAQIQSQITDAIVNGEW